MPDYTPEKQDYIKMLEALRDLGPTFNACAQLQDHYEKPVSAHNDLLYTNKKYSDLFNAYCNPRNEQNEFNYTVKTMSASRDKEPMRSIKMLGELIMFLPTTYMQFRRESKIADMGIAHQPKI